MAFSEFKRNLLSFHGYLLKLLFFFSLVVVRMFSFGRQIIFLQICNIIHLQLSISFYLQDIVVANLRYLILILQQQFEADIISAREKNKLMFRDLNYILNLLSQQIDRQRYTQKFPHVLHYLCSDESSVLLSGSRSLEVLAALTQL